MAQRPPDSLTSEAAFRREIASWALLGLTLGLVECERAVGIERDLSDDRDVLTAVADDFLRRGSLRHFDHRCLERDVMP